MTAGSKQAGRGKDAPAPSDLAARPRASVLVVDDEAGVRSYLADALSSEGHEVEQAADGVAALALLKRRSFQVMVTDLRMPKMDGMALLAQARSLSPDLEVILLTAHGSVESAVQAMKLGAFDYLQKPISSPTELRLLVARAVERYRLRAVHEQAASAAGEPSLSHGSAAMDGVVAALRKVAVTDATVLLLGDSGTGKEVAAQALHRWSRRAGGPFVAINCAALPETLLESELFGHERGAFTGAATRRRGRIELADGGTCFLDEIGELQPALQVKLLRVLQERQFERVGGNQTVHCNVRWVAATNRNLAEQMARGAFREDLYHRLAVFPVTLPTLAERRDEIPRLARTLLVGVGAELGRPGLALTDEACELLAQRYWPGNVRQLRNTLERAAIVTEGPELDADTLALATVVAGAASDSPAILTMVEAERQAIERALAHHDGNRRRAAEQLGIGLRTLYDKLKRYGMG
ncbi:MAG: sigma-54-dependent Fis family transcriptional regulator [Deltaproteobacteria bacterium]|nr:sigma-54-dependent Fis family transcriptional regulator [Deltaproteobacteria bacterium]